VGSHGQEYNCFIRQVVTKTVFTLGNVPAFFADNKDNPEISINADAAAAGQVQSAADIAEGFGSCIRISKNFFSPAFNGLADGSITAQIADEQVFV